MDDPFAALDSIADVLKNDDDPFAALAALAGSGGPKKDDDINAMFEDLERSSASLSTVLAGFFFEEFGLNFSADDVLSEKGIVEEHLALLQEFLATRLGIQFTAEKALDKLGSGTRFWALVGHVDQLARKQNLDVQEATDKVLVPVEEAPVAADPAPAVVADAPKSAAQKLAAEETSASATPKTRRKNAVEKVDGEKNLFRVFQIVLFARA